MNPELSLSYTCTLRQKNYILDPSKIEQSTESSQPVETMCLTLNQREKMIDL